jgi:hypothetical protein
VDVPGSATFWNAQHTLSQIGQTFVAPPDIVGGIAATSVNPDVLFTSQVGPQPGGFGGYDDLSPPTGTNMDLGQLRMQLFVSNPTAYRVTSIERTINNVILEWVPGGVGEAYRAGGMQTVRLYGVQVPEPSTLILSIAIGLHTLLNRHCGNNERR